MKNFLSLVLLATSMTALAQNKVEMNGKNVFVNASEAILVRTANTPKIVDVTFMVPMKENVCLQTATRRISVPCGRRYYRGGRGRYGRPYGGYYGGSYGMCVSQQTYCVSYGQNTSFESDKVRLKFKKAPALGGSEEETFLVIAQQNGTDSNNVVYNVAPQSTLVKYEVKDRGIFNIDKFVIKPAK